MADKSAYMSAGGYSSRYMGSNASSSGYAREDYASGGSGAQNNNNNQGGSGGNTNPEAQFNEMDEIEKENQSLILVLRNKWRQGKTRVNVYEEKRLTGWNNKKTHACQRRVKRQLEKDEEDRTAMLRDVLIDDQIGLMVFLRAKPTAEFVNQTNGKITVGSDGKIQEIRVHGQMQNLNYNPNKYRGPNRKISTSHNPLSVNSTVKSPSKSSTSTVSRKSKVEVSEMSKTDKNGKKKMTRKSQSKKMPKGGGGLKSQLADANEDLTTKNLHSTIRIPNLLGNVTVSVNVSVTPATEITEENDGSGTMRIPSMKSSFESVPKSQIQKQLKLKKD